MDEEINADVEHKIRAGWLECRLTSGVLMIDTYQQD